MSIRIKATLNEFYSLSTFISFNKSRPKSGTCYPYVYLYVYLSIPDLYMYLSIPDLYVFLSIPDLYLYLSIPEPYDHLNVNNAKRKMGME